MRKFLLTLIITGLTNFERYGVMWVIALVYPVSWNQDTEMKNEGYDILTFKPKTTSYYHGRWGTNPNWR